MKVLWGAWRHWMLITTMARRQFQLRYRQSLVGVTWAILPTLGTLLASTLVFHKVAGVNSGTMPYALVTLSALVPWSFFAASISTGVPSISNAQPLVTRLAFPKAVIPLSNVGTSLIDMGTTLLIFVAWVIVAGIGLPLTALWVPVLVVLELGLIVGVLLLCSALNVFARDMKLLVPLLTSLWLLVTPVMYPLSAVPADLQGPLLAQPDDRSRGVLQGCAALRTATAHLLFASLDHWGRRVLDRRQLVLRRHGVSLRGCDLMDVVTLEHVTKTYRIGVGRARVREMLPAPLDSVAEKVAPNWWTRDTFNALEDVSFAVPGGVLDRA